MLVKEAEYDCFTRIFLAINLGVGFLPKGTGVAERDSDPAERTEPSGAPELSSSESPLSSTSATSLLSRKLLRLAVEVSDTIIE